MGRKGSEPETFSESDEAPSSEDNETASNESGGGLGRLDGAGALRQPPRQVTQSNASASPKLTLLSPTALPQHEPSNGQHFAQGGPQGNTTIKTGKVGKSVALVLLRDLVPSGPELAALEALAPGHTFGNALTADAELKFQRGFRLNVAGRRAQKANPNPFTAGVQPNSSVVVLWVSMDESFVGHIWSCSDGQAVAIPVQQRMEMVFMAKCQSTDADWLKTKTEFNASILRLSPSSASSLSPSAPLPPTRGNPPTKGRKTVQNESGVQRSLCKNRAELKRILSQARLKRKLDWMESDVVQEFKTKYGLTAELKSDIEKWRLAQVERLDDKKTYAMT